MSSKYAKFFVAGAIAALTALQAALTDNSVSPQEYVVIALAAAGALGVYFVPNQPSG